MEKSNASPAAKRVRDGEIRADGTRERTLRSCEQKAFRQVWEPFSGRYPGQDLIESFEKQNRWHHEKDSRSSYCFWDERLSFYFQPIFYMAYGAKGGSYHVFDYGVYRKRTYACKIQRRV